MQYEIICADPAKNTYLWHFPKFATNCVNIDPHEKYEMVTFYFIQNWDQVGDCLICSKLQYLSKVWSGLIWFCICPIWSLILADHFLVTLPLLHRWSLVNFFLHCSGLYFPTGDLAIEETLVTCDKEADVCFGKVAKVVSEKYLSSSPRWFWLCQTVPAVVWESFR